mmetsp:Transcript_30043/g.41875  ORF Transcript_30043/g.41875 Transcript_30043/m.41875 type:complete len:368 (-) Transcript_30043:320-1423(-)
MEKVTSKDSHRPRKRRLRLITCGSGASAVAQMRESSDLLSCSDYNSLKARLDSDGYLFFRDFLPRSDVIKARVEILKMAEVPPEAISRTECTFRPLEVSIFKAPSLRLLARQDIASSPAVQMITENAKIRDFFCGIFGCKAVATTRYKWLRSVSTGEYTGVHIDRVYLAGGSNNLTTMWIPFGDIPMRHGSLLVNAGSNKKVDDLLTNISSPASSSSSPASALSSKQSKCEKDVSGDTKCCPKEASSVSPSSSVREAAVRYVQGNGGKTGDKTTAGWLATEPKNVPSVFCGDGMERAVAPAWVSTDFKAGDVAIVSLNTVHMSTTNTSKFWRISCDTRWQPANEPKNPALKFKVMQHMGQSEKKVKS